MVDESCIINTMCLQLQDALFELYTFQKTYVQINNLKLIVSSILSLSYKELAVMPKYTVTSAGSLDVLSSSQLSGPVSNTLRREGQGLSAPIPHGTLPTVIWGCQRQLGQFLQRRLALDLL